MATSRARRAASGHWNTRAGATRDGHPRPTWRQTHPRDAWVHDHLYVPQRPRRRHEPQPPSVWPAVLLGIVLVALVVLVIGTVVL